MMIFRCWSKQLWRLWRLWPQANASLQSYLDIGTHIETHFPQALDVSGCQCIWCRTSTCRTSDQQRCRFHIFHQLPGALGMWQFSPFSEEFFLEQLEKKHQKDPKRCLNFAELRIIVLHRSLVSPAPLRGRVPGTRNRSFSLTSLTSVHC